MVTKRELEEINDTLRFKLSEAERKLGETKAENKLLRERYDELMIYVESLREWLSKRAKSMSANRG